MGRVAVFVDAGYLFAKGASTLVGADTPRSNIRINETAALAEFKDVCQAKATKCDLLRVYWYDGIHGFKGPSLEQERLSHTDNIKTRFGFINSFGEQKGVDSLIVTDLIDLARNHAISDALLISGDEDVRVGVQIAQQFGVRIHLIGIGTGNQSQSKTLKQEADTTTVWDRGTVAKFLTVQLPEQKVEVKSSETAPLASADESKGGRSLTSEVEKKITEFVGNLDGTEIPDLCKHWQTSGGIPPEYDGRLLARVRAVIERDLDASEKKLVRTMFKNEVRKKLP